MKKLLFAIFAHPDDEAFGPSGTLLLETRAGTELHLITLTAGGAGDNPDSHEDLSAVRLQEWHAAGELIGAAGMHCLDYQDGHLDNIAMQQAATRLLQFIQSVAATQAEAYEIELMSMDTNGSTGHIDHIVASRLAHYLYYSLSYSHLPVTRLRLACITQEATGTNPNLDFVYMEPGRTPDEIDEVIDARSVLDEVYAIMRCHHTQRADGERHIAQHGDRVAINHFIVK